MATSNSGNASFLRGPVFWGTLASLAFYSLIFTEVLHGEFVYRYFNSHPVINVEVVMFFVGMTAVLMKAREVRAQRAVVAKPLIEAAPPQGQSPEDCDALLAQLDAAPAEMQRGYLIDRMRSALAHIRRKGSADGLDDQLRYFADVDAAKMQESYGLVRINLWAIPILGMLGTVIGITMGLAEFKISGGATEAYLNSVQQMTDALKIAFDTTSLALALSIPLMFAKYFTERVENQLLETVEERVTVELIGRFEQPDEIHDPHAAAVRRMGEKVVQATERTVERQAELWRDTIEVAHQHWSRLATGAGQQTEEAISAALDRGLGQFAARLDAAERSVGDQNRQHWDHVQQALLQSSELVAAQQREMVRQGEVMLRVVEATAHVQRLEEALNHNLAALAGSHHFEQTVTSLAAAIQLLSARLAPAPRGVPRVELNPTTSGRAA